MSPDESVQLLALARAAFPGMSVVEGMPLVWHGSLGDLQLSESVAAVIEHAKVSERIVTVADIRRLVVTARRAIAGEERREQIEAVHPAPSSQERVPMTDWFRSTVAEHTKRARAAREDVKDGDPVTFGSQIMSAFDGMPKGGWR